MARRTFELDLRSPAITTNPGNAFFNVTGLTAYDSGAFEFIPTGTGVLYAVRRVPDGLGGTPAPTVILTGMANATTGAVRLSLASAAAANAASLNPASLTAAGAAQDVAVPGTARNRFDTTFTLGHAVAAGDLLLVAITREGAHANDSCAVNYELITAVLDVDLA